MIFELAPGAASRFDQVQSTGSTNSDLVAAASANPADYPSFSVLVTQEQTSGRGRAGRQWLAPAGSSLFVSVLIRPGRQDLDSYGWLPLMAGLSLTEAIQSTTSIEAQIKWPNDLLISGKKVAGILSELIPGQKAVVIGFGVNLFQEREELPVENSTSLALEGYTGRNVDRLLSHLLHCLHRNMEWFDSASSFGEGNYLRETISKKCATLTREVKVLLPGDESIVGVAERLDDLGRLVVQSGGETRTISVGDIVHLRHN